MILLNGTRVTPTIFPDGTSQVWKLVLGGRPTALVEVVEFTEVDVFHLLQLGLLLKESGIPAVLDMPFLPYGRQDKEIANQNTFALHAFGRVLQLCGFVAVHTVDAHSDVLSQYVRLESFNPKPMIDAAISHCGATAVCYPDSGAATRYTAGLRTVGTIVLGKTRVQGTGEITGMELVAGCVLPGDSVLIVDDICDGGRTFIEACKLIKSIEPTASVHLYVSHGIFSKGIDVLRDAGICHIFTKDGIV